MEGDTHFCEACNVEVDQDQAMLVQVPDDHEVYGNGQ